LSPVVTSVVTIKLEKMGSVVSFRGRSEREIFFILGLAPTEIYGKPTTE
jgi:hypothetical protein